MPHTIRCPQSALATGVWGMMTGDDGVHLNAWIEQVDTGDLLDLHRLTAGLLRDHATVVNGLIPPHSSTP